LPLVGTLIDCLINELTAPEVVDFLPFIGMLVHRYKVGGKPKPPPCLQANVCIFQESFAEMLDVLIGPVFDRVYFFLEQPVTGTDDIQQHSELRRAYFNVVLSIANANMHSVFFSPSRFPAACEILLRPILTPSTPH
jgi:exportin-T